MYLLVFIQTFVVSQLCYANLNSQPPWFNAEWVVRLQGGSTIARNIANDMGYDFHGKVMGFKDTYLFAQKHRTLLPSHQKRSQERDLTRALNSDQRVIWAERQYAKPRQKRDLFAVPADSFIRIKRDQRQKSRMDRTFNDELWSQEWYLQDTRTRTDLPKLDLNVLPVYKAGITGKGIRVTILDDGLEYTHDDLRDNYDPDISWDCNENDADPTPRYDARSHNSHGTRCAGEVAMSANNRKCGVGIAFNAHIGGVKLLDGFVNDRIEGTALGYAYHLVDIYSASWGPNDDGQTVDGPGTLAKEALERGINKGRGGKGSIYVWASGNGGSKGDNCNCDGYLASPFTVSIGSASQRGEFPWYGEECASTMAVTYSSGAYQDQMIATTDLGNECTIKHTGTSASAPLAAGIIALALEINPNLTWRDVQHLTVWTSEYVPVAENPGWQRNAAGLWFNTRFGFGLMNAHGFVMTAANWTTVPQRLFCTVTVEPLTNNTIIHGEAKILDFKVLNCPIKYLEHVEVNTNIKYSVRGDLEIFLKSPAGTTVQLLNRRKLDKSKDGFVDWTFMSVMTWGENPSATWNLEIIDKNGATNNTGLVEDTHLILYGTKDVPEHMGYGPRKYNHNYNRIHKNVPNYDDSYNYINTDYLNYN